MDSTLKINLVRSALLMVLLIVTTASSLFAENRCVVASVNPLATDAGLAAYTAGGNALDAAVATALTLGVVDNHNSGIGGGCFILIRQPDGELLAIDGREMAPAAASRDMYVRDGKADPELSTTGPLAVAVPGALAAYAHALDKCGNKSLADLISPAADIAEKGFPLDRIYAARLKKTAKALSKFDESRRTLLKADGLPYHEGEILRQPDLATSYQNIAEHGIGWFYKGEYAEKVGKWMADNGGILTAVDFAAYKPIEREPLVTTYRDYTIVGFPLPSSGGIHVAQILNIIEPFDVAEEFERDSVQGTHLLIEAMKLAFADRAYWLGDSDFVKVPKGLVDKEYAKILGSRIDLSKASLVAAHGEPPQAEQNVFKKHTTHIAAADSEGYWVAITATVNTSFGSKVIVPGTGIILNNEMDDFSSQPGVPNAFGLVGAENNSIAPGKRPLSSMSPTIVLNANDQPVLTVGAAGGPKIITQVVQVMVRTIDLDEDLNDAIAAPRFHHQWEPNSVLVESAVPKEVLDGLKAFGHKIEVIDESGITQGIAVDADGAFRAVHDPRVPGKAASATR
jgi:gamma-glutamyltranspeptidase / glutathione hydrolase